VRFTTLSKESMMNIIQKASSFVTRVIQHFYTITPCLALIRAVAQVMRYFLLFSDII